ncbi:MAG: hypothetical protein JO230_13345 [Xanthobacteraceae bacterium]|nr:hypothetical protein [Xanthobacteraceae bacterium]
MAIRMARPPFAVEYHHDPKCKFKFKDNTPDDEWLSKVAAEGWIVFSHDRKFHTLLPDAQQSNSTTLVVSICPVLVRRLGKKCVTSPARTRGSPIGSALLRSHLFFELSAANRFRRITIP